MNNSNEISQENIPEFDTNPFIESEDNNIELIFKKFVALEDIYNYYGTTIPISKNHVLERIIKYLENIDILYAASKQELEENTSWFDYVEKINKLETADLLTSEDVLLFTNPQTVLNVNKFENLDIYKH